jgi:hypothetical protein
MVWTLLCVQRCKPSGSPPTGGAGRGRRAPPPVRAPGWPAADHCCWRPGAGVFAGWLGLVGAGLNRQLAGERGDEQQVETQPTATCKHMHRQYVMTHPAELVVEEQRVRRRHLERRRGAGVGGPLAADEIERDVLLVAQPRGAWLFGWSVVIMCVVCCVCVCSGGKGRRAICVLGKDSVKQARSRMDSAAQPQQATTTH